MRTSALAQAQDYGARLFQAVFSEQVYTNFVTSYNLALQLGKGLRLQLRISDPRLMNLPWEYLYNPDSKSYLSQDNKSPVVRYLDWGGQVVPLSVELPLRILVVIASPDGLPNLKVEEEWLRLNRALDPLIKRRLVQVDRLKKPTLDFLQSYLRRNTCHILHFIGHGVFNPTTKEGLLNFENDEGKNQEVKGQHLGSILRNHASLRLVVLNACEGAQTAINDPFAGIAQSLVQQGLPAVIAMQFPITDQAALKFSHEFYAALADGYALDAALTEARVAIFATGNNIEWGTPVLFMRSTDGKLFNFKPARWYWIAAIIGITVILLAAIGLLKLIPSLFPPLLLLHRSPKFQLFLLNPPSLLVHLHLHCLLHARPLSQPFPPRARPPRPPSLPVPSSRTRSSKPLPRRPAWR